MAYPFNVSPLRGRIFWPTSDEGPLLSPMVKRLHDRLAKKKKEEENHWKRK